MDLVTLQAQIRAARQIFVEHDGARFALELPTEHTWRTVAETHRDGDGRVLHTRAARAVLQEAIIGWEGLTAQHLFAEAPADPLPFSAAARSELLDARQDIADELIAAVGAKLAARREKRETARKN